MWISFQFEKVNKIIIFYYIIISITYNFENSFCTRSIENTDKRISIYILTSYADWAAAYGSLDIGNLIESELEVIIAGTGVNGLVKAERELEEMLSEKGIEFIFAPNQKAVELYNELASKKRIGACFHLAC